MRWLGLNRIRSRLLGLLTATIGGLVLVVIGVWMFHIEPALRLSVAKDQREVAMHGADLIADFIDEKIVDLTAAAQIGQLGQARDDQRKEALYQLMKIVPTIRELSIVNPDGTEVLRVSRTRTFTAADLHSFPITDKIRRPMGGEVYIGPVYHENTAEPFITIAVPIKSTAVENNGVLVAEINLKTLWNVVSHIKVGRNGFLYVVSSTGQLIAHPDYSKVVLGTNMAQVPEVQEFFGSPQQDPGFDEIMVGFGAPRVISTYALVPKPHWGVMVEESIDSAFADAHQLKLLAGIVLGMAVLGGLAVSYRFGRRLTEPITQLEKGAARIASGELDYRLDIHTGDEIETLAQEFNRMALALKESHSGLEMKIAERTKDISSLYAVLAPLKPAESLAQTLDNVLTRLCEATGADAARVRLWDQNQRAYVCPSAIAFDGSAIGAIYPPGHLLVADQVFKSGAAAIISNIATDGRITGGNLLASGFRSAAFLPLIVGRKTIGVVQLASRTEGFFKLVKEAHLMAIARQMGIAMENRDLFEETQRHLKRIRALHQIDTAITSSLNLDEVLHVLLEQIDLFLSFPAIPSITLIDQKTGDFEPTVCRNLDEGEWKSAARKGGSRLAKLVCGTEHFVAIDKLQSDERVRAPEFFVKHGLHSYLGVALKGSQGVLGVLELYTTEAHRFSDGEIEFMATLGGQAAIAIQNSQLFEETRNQAVELKKTNRVKDEFLGVISHELRTPLSVITGYANLLAEETFGTNNPEQAKGIRVIKDRSEALSGLVGTILDAARLASGTAMATMERVSLLSLLSAVKDHYAPQAPDSVALNWEFSPTLPDILTDGGKLRQILNNLIDNALKFTERGSVTISAKSLSREAYLVNREPRQTNNESAIRNPQSEIATHYLELIVRDTGIGMTSEAVRLVFDKFRQADSSENRSYEGAGLGLFVVKKFTELLGGEVYAESEPGRGSIFTVTLPYVPCGAAEQNGVKATSGDEWNGLTSASAALERPLI